MKNKFLPGLIMAIFSIFTFSCGEDDPIIELEAGAITGGPFEFVVDGVADNVSGITLTGDGLADNKGWVITDIDGMILGLPATLEDLMAVNFDGAGAGVCFIYHIVYANGLNGLTPNQNLSKIGGIFDLSNSIKTTRTGIDAGVISGGPFNFTVDGEADFVSGITVTDNDDATNTTWVITDSDRKILGLPKTLEDLMGVNFDGAGVGTCFIYRLTYADGITGLEAGLNISGLGGSAFDLSNNLATVRTAGVEPTMFKVTLTNIINYLSVKVFNTPDGSSAPAPVPTIDGSYSMTFTATPGTYLSFATMNAMSNDWFYSPDGNGITLYTGNGDPVTGDISGQLMKWDSGTEAENPDGWASLGVGQIAHADDTNTSVRLVESSVIDEVGAFLTFNNATGEFTLKVVNRAGGAGGVVITPGLLVIHARDYPFFMTGSVDWGRGLKQIAEDGNPQVLYDWFTALGSDDVPLRLSSSMTPFAPGLAYVFAGSGKDPLFTQGSAAVGASGLEVLSEDGNASTAVSYLTGQSIAAVAADQMAPVFPGQEMTFEIAAKPGYHLGFATMFIQSNDWFFSFNNDGLALWDSNGNPVSGNFSAGAYLFDAGTEEDQSVGLGADQAPRQSGGNTGAADDDTSVRRVGSIEDLQFGKGTLTSVAGAAGYGDVRGGYNLIKISIQPL